MIPVWITERVRNSSEETVVLEKKVSAVWISGPVRDSSEETAVLGKMVTAA